MKVAFCTPEGLKAAMYTLKSMGTPPRRVFVAPELNTATVCLDIAGEFGHEFSLAEDRALAAPKNGDRRFEARYRHGFVAVQMQEDTTYLLVGDFAGMRHIVDTLTGTGRIAATTKSAADQEAWVIANDGPDYKAGWVTRCVTCDAPPPSDGGISCHCAAPA